LGNPTHTHPHRCICPAPPALTPLRPTPAGRRRTGESRTERLYKQAIALQVRVLVCVRERERWWLLVCAVFPTSRFLATSVGHARHFDSKRPGPMHAPVTHIAFYFDGLSWRPSSAGVGACFPTALDGENGVGDHWGVEKKPSRMLRSTQWAWFTPRPSLCYPPPPRTQAVLTAHFSCFSA
jgi:hypothetical protein